MKTIHIINGPSVDDLFLGLKLHAEKRLIPFGIIRAGEQASKPGEESFLVTLIRSIDAAAQTGESWNITFFVQRKCLELALNPPAPKAYETGVLGKRIGFSAMKNWIEFERTSGERDQDVQVCAPKDDVVLVQAFYSTKNRHGLITIEE